MDESCFRRLLLCCELVFLELLTFNDEFADTGGLVGQSPLWGRPRIPSIICTISSSVGRYEAHWGGNANSGRSRWASLSSKVDAFRMSRHSWTLASQFAYSSSHM